MGQTRHSTRALCTFERPQEGRESQELRPPGLPSRSPRPAVYVPQAKRSLTFPRRARPDNGFSPGWPSPALGPSPHVIDPGEDGTAALDRVAAGMAGLARVPGKPRASSLRSRMAMKPRTRLNTGASGSSGSRVRSCLSTLFSNARAFGPRRSSHQQLVRSSRTSRPADSRNG
jgi:hypothetical protein